MRKVKLTRRQISQRQHFYRSQQKMIGVLKEAAFMAGVLKDETGKFNSNPLSQKEIRSIASSDKPYAWAFKQLINL